MVESVDVADVLNTVIHGDALAVLKTLPSNSLSAMVTDPPAGIGFMLDQKSGRTWDSDKGGRDQWVSWLTDIMREAYRVLMPGAHCLVWSLPRTSHWTGYALENSGFEIRDSLAHLYAQDTKLAAFYATLSQEQRNLFEQIVDNAGMPSGVLACFGSGFPKSLSIDKAIDAHLKAKREVVGSVHTKDIRRNVAKDREMGIEHDQGKWAAGAPTTYIDHPITAPATEQARKWKGWQSALKPAYEHWLLVRKPLSERNLAENVLKWSTGGLNIDGARISCADKAKFPAGAVSDTESVYGNGKGRYEDKPRPVDFYPSGRFPSHLLLSHSLACIRRGTKRVRGTHGNGSPIPHSNNKIYGTQSGPCLSHDYTDADGMEEIEEWECAEGCPIRAMDEQSGIRNSHGNLRPHINRSNAPSGFNKNTSAIVTSERIGDTGTASRYFAQFSPPQDMAPFIYHSKASRRERNQGCEALPEMPAGIMEDRPSGSFQERLQGHKTPMKQNDHPTVKAQSLLKYLCRIVCPPGGTVLDMFGGSGSTALACISEGFNYILIEQDEHYCHIAQARIAHALSQQPTPPRPPAPRMPMKRQEKLEEPIIKGKLAQVSLWDKPAEEQEVQEQEMLQHQAQGRFPSHLLMSHSVYCVLRGMKKVKREGGHGEASSAVFKTNSLFGFQEGQIKFYCDADGFEEVQDWDCHPSCPIRQMNEQSEGMPTRYFQTFHDGENEQATGRFPSHLIMSHSLSCTPEECAEGCPVKVMGEQSGECHPHRSPNGNTISHHKGGQGNTYGMQYERTSDNNYTDTGTAARYFQTFFPSQDSEEEPPV